MACTQQCATDYLRNARQVLIRHLQNFPLITENLYQRKVFNEHEVDALQAEKTDFNRARFILDYVTNKGELACYELLKILDITRERTLHPDSHHWISCFPFSEDADIDYIVGTKPCLSYQKQLEAKAKSISGRRWDQCCKRLQDKTRVHVTFIPLVLDTDADLNSAQNKIKIKNRKCKKCRPKKLKSFIPVQTHKLSPEDLLCSHEKEILVIGKPGIGKTAVVLQMLSLWSSKDSRKLDYMFYFDESTFTTISNLISLESLLFDMYLKPLEKNRKEVLQDIEENSENVIIMFDGISTLEHNPITKKIIERDLLPEAKIVITCRSEEEDEFLFSHRHPCRVYVKGFSEESIRTYLTQMIGSTPELLNIVLNNQDLISLCHVPMYAFMVVYCISFSVTAHKHPITVTEMYVHILRQDLKKAGRKNAEQVDKYINDVKGQLFLLMKTAFAATMQKIVNIKDAVSNEIEITQCFLRKITIQNTPTSVNSFYAFLHSTVQEFFSALWLLGNPGEIDEVLQNCLTKEQKHMKHVIPFLCGLLSEQNLKLLKNLFTEDQIRRASDGMFTKVLNTFLQPQPNGQLGGDDDEVSVLLFVCQCLYESQSPEACLLFLEKMNYDLDLSGEDLDPHQCCAVSYVISQSREKQVHLSLEDCSVSDTGIQMILRFKSHFRDKPSTLCHVWRSVLCCEKPRDFTALLDICGKEMHLPVPGEASIFLKAEEVMSQGSEKISLHLHCTEDTQRFSDDLCNVVVKALPYVKSLSFSAPSYMEVSSSRLKMKSILKICVHAALYKKENIQVVVPKVAVLSEHDSKDFLMDLYSYVKDYEAQTGSSVFPVLQPLYRSFPVWYTMSNVWSINLMERKASHFLEALKVQTAKKPVNVWGWSDEESEVRSFLQCLPYISQLRVLWTGFYEEENKMCAIQFLLKLIVTAAECDAATGESFTKLLTSVCSYTNFPFGDDVSIKSSQCDFLLDLCSHVKDYETQTGRSVLPALQSVYQSAPAVWNIDLSERKTSLFQEVLKLQTVKKPVKLRGWSDEESEVRSFLQCLPYISQLSFVSPQNQTESYKNKKRLFLLKLSLQAAVHQRDTVKRTIEELMSHTEDKEYFLLDLYSRVKDYETQTGRSVLPALQPVYQSAPAVWHIDLSERKTPLFLEVLKIQTVKKPVELRGWSDEESEVRSFLQCLPYISQLRFEYYVLYSKVKRRSAVEFLLKLIVTAAECDAATGETFTKLLTSVCSYTNFPVDGINYQCDFLLDLYSRVKDYETQTGRSVLPALQPVYQSAPAVWNIDLSERKTSLFLEVLKLHTVKKPVELRGWSDEESEVRSFLQCLPYISQLRFEYDVLYSKVKRRYAVEFLLKLIVTAAECDAATGESFTKLLTSVCSYTNFPIDGINYQCDFLLDLSSRVKDYETQTGRSVLPALQPVYQSAPAVWYIDLSERKTSLFLEVLKLQTVKKPVKLWGWSDEESEVRSFLQCLPYISHLKFNYVLRNKEQRRSAVEFLLKLIVTAAECDAATGESFTKLLTSVCSYTNFPVDGINYQCDFLLDLCSRVKDYETQTGRSVLPALQPVYQSAPAVWNIDLSERKTSLFLEVLKLHTVKKPVELRGWSDEESEVRSFLQCLPYISQLRFEYFVFYYEEQRRSAVEFLLNLTVTASECDAATGESFTKLLTSVCSYTNFPVDGINYQCDFLLDLYSRVKDYETQTGRNVLPALQPIYQSAPAVWNIDLSERKTSIFLEVLKLHTVKKPVELRGWSDEESELRSFLQCLPYISHLRFLSLQNQTESYKNKKRLFLLNLSLQAAVHQRDTVKRTIEELMSHTEDKEDFLLDLYSRVKDYETQTGRSVLPVLQPVYQSAHVVWNIDLSERKTSFFLEVLKLQTVKKPVELRGWSDEESEVRSFLQCLPYISQLSGADPYIPSLCKELQSRDQAGQVSPLLQALDFTLSLGGQLSTPSCRAVGRVLGLSASTLNLTLNPQAISLRGVRLLFTHITHLRILSVSGAVVVKMVRTLRTVRSPAPVTVEELSLIHTSTQQPEGALSRVLSSLASLLRLWRVQCLNLTDYKMEAQSLTVLLCHQGHLTIRLSKESLQRLVAMVFEAQEEEFTHCFLQKVGGDLTSCTLTWEVIDYFLQFQSVTVDFRKSDTGQQNPRELLSVLDRLQIRRLSPSCVLSIITEIYQTGSAHCVSSLLSSTENCITLNSRELDSVHCAALCFTLQHCTAVSLSLLFTSIPEGELESIVPLLKHVSHLSVDRLLLLRLLHCCVSELQQGAAVVLLSALQHRLDFSCSSALDLTEDSHTHTLTLSTEDCRVVSVAVQRAHTHTQLTLHDCEIEEAGVEQLFPIIHTVTLQCSKVVLLQFLSLVRVGSELECVRRAVSLSRALGGEVDLSHTRLDQQACGSLALVLEHSEGLSELDLSHCQLTDHCLQLLCPQLHKAHILDLSHNDITDVSAKIIYDTVSINTNIHTVRLFNNRITDRQVFLSDKRFVLRSGDVNVVFVTGRLSDIKWKRSRQVSGKKDGLI
ncbi:uncharacterized protein LOC143523348 isoform X9 [Brachyhypopomus gauderio]|uniref:uncharacterized protein LOC143523348 isoform X9 n=1 Tax=Brachyhypopomus gauderio TaxID=698409 RepID=UPI004041DC65